jgi:hypothetical protein
MCQGLKDFGFEFAQSFGHTKFPRKERLMMDVNPYRIPQPNL